MVKIKCPNCGGEYLISEIFYSDDLLDNPEVVIRDEENNLVDSTDISEIRKSEYKLTIESKKNIRIRIKYKRTYRKEGFIRAGRLLISGV